MAPGGIYVTFTGHEVRYADGRQLQRIGIIPDVRVSPTVKAYAPESTRCSIERWRI